jgi:hypothetical protein
MPVGTVRRKGICLFVLFCSFSFSFSFSFLVSFSASFSGSVSASVLVSASVSASTSVSFSPVFSVCLKNYLHAAGERLTIFLSKNCACFLGIESIAISPFCNLE